MSSLLTAKRLFSANMLQLIHCTSNLYCSAGQHFIQSGFRFNLYESLTINYSVKTAARHPSHCRRNTDITKIKDITLYDCCMAQTFKLLIGQEEAKRESVIEELVRLDLKEK